MIRKAEIKDADSIADLYIDSRKTHVSFAPIACPEEGVRSWIRDILIPKRQTLVIEDGGVIVGMIATFEDEEGSWIDQLYIKSDRTGERFGSTLLSAALEGLKRPVRLHTFQENSGARRFYERKGFEPTKFTDGSTNAEKCPDVLYTLKDGVPNQTLQTTSASRRV